MPRFLAAVPIFRASNLATSIAYYTGTLGFVANGVYRNDPNGPDGYAFLSRDGVRIHLSSYGGDGPFATVATSTSRASMSCTPSGPPPGPMCSTTPVP